MSVIVVKSETNEYRILVKAGDEDLARQEAVKAAISAEAARISAIAAGDSEQVATEKAAQTVEDAASALASKQASESAATASEGFATDSNDSAVASEVARLASVAAQGIATTQAQNSSISAGQSAASAAAAAASSALITTKAEVNIVTAGNVLRADGTLFKSISEVEFLRSKTPFSRSILGALFNSKNIYGWDSFDRPNTVSGLGNADSGQAWETIGGSVKIINKYANINNYNFALIPIQGGTSQRIIFGGATEFGNNRSIIAVFYKNQNECLLFRYNAYQLWVQKRVNGVFTDIISIVNQTALEPCINLNVGFIDCSIYRQPSKARLRIAIPSFNIFGEITTTDVETLSIIDGATKVGISGETVTPNLGINSFVAQSLTNL
jgi:hypothetical protein